MGLGFWEITILLLIVAIIFGAGKLPAVMGDLAKGIKSFKSELATDKAEPAPAAAAEVAVPPAPAPAGASPIIEATATRVPMTDPAPPPARSA